MAIDYTTVIAACIAAIASVICAFFSNSTRKECVDIKNSINNSNKNNNESNINLNVQQPNQQQNNYENLIKHFELQNEKLIAENKKLQEESEKLTAENKKLKAENFKAMIQDSERKEKEIAIIGGVPKSPTKWQ